MKFLKIVFSTFALVILLSSCSTSSTKTAMGDGNNAFGVPPRVWNNMTPEQQRQIILGHMRMRRKRALKKSNQAKKSTVAKQTKSLYPTKMSAQDKETTSRSNNPAVITSETR